MTDTTTRPSLANLARTLMEVALRSSEEVVEYTASYATLHSLRVECYRVRSFARDVDDHKWDKLTFAIKAVGEQLKLQIAVKQ